MVFYMADGTTVSVAPKFTGSSYLDTASGNVGTILGVDDEDMPIIHELLRVWREKYPRNLIRGAYYDCKERFKDFGISIPDQIKNKVEAMIGWPELAVRSLSDLSDLEGFSVSGDDTMGVNDLFEDNQLDVATSELIVSAYKHSCSFLTIAADPENPDRISMIPRSADWSAGIWDRRNHRLAAALTITEDDKDGRICAFNVWLPGKVYECSGHLTPWLGGENRNELRPADCRRARLRQADGPAIRPQPHQPFAHEPRRRRIPHRGPHGGVGRILFRSETLVHRSEQGRVQQQHMDESHPGDQRDHRGRERRASPTASGAAGVHDAPFGHAQDLGHARRLADPSAGRLSGHHVGQSDQRRGHGIRRTTVDAHRRQAERGLRAGTQTGHGHRRGIARRREHDTRLHTRRASGMGAHKGNLRRGARRRVHEDRRQDHRLRRLRCRTRTSRPDPRGNHPPTRRPATAEIGTTHRPAHGQKRGVLGGDGWI